MTISYGQGISVNPLAFAAAAAAVVNGGTLIRPDVPEATARRSSGERVISEAASRIDARADAARRDRRNRQQGRRAGL